MLNAVEIDNAKFSYGSKQILCNYCSRIPYSQIYALLGPSGGGKTTLLRLILGRLKLQQGSIKVLGQSPPPESNRNISFMPQEIGLCDTMTIKQTLRYFKLIYRISNEDFYIRFDSIELNSLIIDIFSIFSRRKELTKLVDLPNGHVLIRNLSGGTKRRLSIIVALINNPRLVILDEPTVGIDPLLRTKIWNYFVSKTRQGITMIIVTHYIEEAINAGRVGLMRNGALLAEDNPQRLIKTYGEPNLEAVFLKLCRYEDDGVIFNNKAYETSVNDSDHFVVNLTQNESICSSQNFYKESSDNSHIKTIENNFDGSHSKIDTIIYAPRCSRLQNNLRLSTTISSIMMIMMMIDGWFKQIDKSVKLFDQKLLKINLWILFTLIYRNLNQFICSYFSLIIVLLPATQSLIFCMAVSKDITNVSQI